MGPNIYTEVKIPDLWFDFYARLLPGTAFVAATYYFLSTSPKIPDGTGVVVGLLAGYFCGLVTQPISSRVTGLLHWFTAWVRGLDRLCVKEISKRLDERHSMILSKMHGETTFFVQCAVLGFFLLGFRATLSTVNPPLEAYVLHACVCIAFLLLGLEVADRRLRRARDQNALLGEKDIAVQTTSSVPSADAKNKVEGEGHRS